MYIYIYTYINIHIIMWYNIMLAGTKRVLKKAEQFSSTITITLTICLSLLLIATLD